MFEELKKQLKEIVEIAESCPEPYKERCFSVLLEHFLSSKEKMKEFVGKPNREEKEESFSGEWSPAFLKFIEEYGLKEAIYQIFHFEDGKCEIIVKDLRTNNKATGQVNLALLLGIKHLAEEGAPNVPNEELRQLCDEHAVLDSANFSANMKKNKNLFLPTKRKGKKDWKLTKPGENKAAELIKELAGDNAKGK